MVDHWWASLTPKTDRAPPGECKHQTHTAQCKWAPPPPLPNLPQSLAMWSLRRTARTTSSGTPWTRRRRSREYLVPTALHLPRMPSLTHTPARRIHRPPSQARANHGDWRAVGRGGRRAPHALRAERHDARHATYITTQDLGPGQQLAHLAAHCLGGHRGHLSVVGAWLEGVRVVVVKALTWRSLRSRPPPGQQPVRASHTNSNPALFNTPHTPTRPHHRPTSSSSSPSL